MHFARTASLTLSLALVGLLSACGGDSKDGEEKKATQVAAKVNADEITVHQINSALPRMNNPSEAQVKAATKQALERLIDQQLFIQKAIEGKLDRDPQVMTAIENSRREILARAYVERVMANAAASDPAAIKDFYDKHPELFAQRKVYRLQEVALQVRGEELDKLKQALPPMKSLQEVIAYAKANNLRATTNASVRAAEQLPMEFAKRIAGLKDGEVVAVPGPNGVAVIQIVASQQQPLDEAKAKPFIEQFIQNKSRMELAQAELKSLRAAAKLEYVGDFAKPAEEAAAPAPEANGGMGSSLEQQAGQQPVPATGGGADDDALQKGLSGLKK
jgi:EpsD family peptidyl-prolyl cis-trans isomerase